MAPSNEVAGGVISRPEILRHYSRTCEARRNAVVENQRKSSASEAILRDMRACGSEQHAIHATGKQRIEIALLQGRILLGIAED